jgi:peptidyl-prolyl cis-trans isomerase A (cyclophilin A)
MKISVFVSRPILRRSVAAIASALVAILAFSSQAATATGLKNGLYAQIKTSASPEPIVLTLEFEKTPLTVCNFVALAEGKLKTDVRSNQRYFDGLNFHRVIDNFMIQGGCPQGTGSGNPGYKFADEFHTDLTHSGPGTLSMANSGPASNGSQFFITHKDTPHLDGKHTVFGHVVNGLDIVNAVAKGDKIEKVTILRIGAKAKAFNANQEAFDKRIATAATPERMAQMSLSSQVLQYLSRTPIAGLITQQKQQIAASVTAGKDALAKSHVDAKKGSDFLAANKKKPGVKVTKSGLQYTILKQGNGAKPKAHNVVTVHYKGTLADGTEFDSSYKRNEPASFPLFGVIAGWTEGVQLMSVGGKAQFIIPQELAYGPAGKLPKIPQFAPLTFEIELLKIN